MALLSFLDPVLTPLLHLVNDPNNPAFGAIFGVFIIATIVAFVITLANKLLVDQDRLQFLQGEMKVFQQEMMQAQKSGDPKLMKDAQKKQAEFMDIQKEMMINSFKPMIVTFVPILVVYYWMSQTPAISTFFVKLPTIAYYIFLVPLFQWVYLTFYHSTVITPPFTIGWLGWYILCSFAMSWVFRKFLGLKGAM